MHYRVRYEGVGLIPTLGHIGDSDSIISLLYQYTFVTVAISLPYVLFCSPTLLVFSTIACSATGNWTPDPVLFCHGFLGHNS